jgi:uncharacterized RDD family membrane protein YckC
LTDHNPYAPPQAEVGDPPHVAETGNLASRTLRFAGSLIDGLANAVVGIPLVLLFDLWEPMMAGGLSSRDAYLVSFGGIAVFLLINGYLLATAGQTIGKRLVGTRIVNVSDDRVPKVLTLVGARYGTTWIIGLIPGIGPLYGVIDVLFIFRDDRRCLHDLFAGTKVVIEHAAQTA